MNKGASQVVTVVFLLLIGLSMTALLYEWAPQVVKNIYPEETQNVQYMRQRSCIGIQNITTTSITINNCGSVTLEGFNVYLNGINQNLAVPILETDKNYTITVPTITSKADVQVTSKYAQTPVVKFVP